MDDAVEDGVDVGGEGNGGFPNRIELTAEDHERLTARGVRIVDGAVSRLVADGGRVTGVDLADGQTVPRGTVFVGPRFLPRDELLTGMGCELGDSGWVITDPTGSTSVPGAWAAGNVVSAGAQLINAAAAGSLAAIALNHHLLAQDVERAVTDYRVANRTHPRMTPADATQAGR